MVGHAGQAVQASASATCFSRERSCSSCTARVLAPHRTAPAQFQGLVLPACQRSYSVHFPHFSNAINSHKHVLFPCSQHYSTRYMPLNNFYFHVDRRKKRQSSQQLAVRLRDEGDAKKFSSLSPTEIISEHRRLPRFSPCPIVISRHAQFFTRLVGASKPKLWRHLDLSKADPISVAWPPCTAFQKCLEWLDPLGKALRLAHPAELRFEGTVDGRQ